MEYKQPHKHFPPLPFGEGLGGWLLTALLLCSVSVNAQTVFSYKVKGTLPDDSFNGKTIYIERYDNHKQIDSTTVSGRDFMFEGQADRAYFCRIDAGREYTNLVLDKGTITADFGTHICSGTELNGRLVESMNRMRAMNDDFLSYRKKVTEEKSGAGNQQLLISEYYDNKIRPEMATFVKKTVVENRDNGVALAVLYEGFDTLLPEEVDTLRTQFGDWLSALESVKQLMANHDKRKATAEGKKFVDFEGEGLDGGKLRLSDFVGKGKYVLADMWASWCGPCKAETPNIAELYNTYRDKGLVVLGIATWDKAKNIKKAVADLNITWPQLVDTGNAVTEKYGVDGIPHIILFAPDGTIVARNLRGDGMKAKVKEVMENKK